MKTNLINSVTRSLGKVRLQLKQHSPEIMVVAGCVGVVASAVMACKATTKASEILEETKKNVEDVHTCLETHEDYTVEDSKKDLTIVYVQTGLKFVKLYGPAVLLGALSITSILASNNILRKRNLALAAAYATVDKGFKDYRGRVVERFGEELDRELLYNIRKKEVEEVVVNEDGTQTVVKKTVDVVDPNDIGYYAKFFDEYCVNWSKNAEDNYLFLKQQLNYANEILNSRGYIFLNEVYEMLGFDTTVAGHVVGWMKNGDGQGFVDFGMYDIHNEKARDFINGREKSILLSFNPDGTIYHKVFSDAG